MDLPHDSVTQNSPYTVNRRLSGDTSVSEVFGFPIAANQFSTLQSSQPAETQCQLHKEEGLMDPRTTRHLRNAAQRTDDEGSLAYVGMPATVPKDRNTQGILYSGNVVNPVVSGNGSQFFVHNSLSASSSDILELQSVEPVHYLLGTGASDDDALYTVDVKDVACTKKSCNKRISCAGPDWSAGRPGLTPFGASSATCPSSQTACIGPYGTAFVQPHHMGCNPREETSLASPLTTGLPRHEDQNTNQ